MNNMTLAEALEASVDALFRPSHRYLQILPYQKHFERFLGWVTLWMIPSILLTFLCEWTIVLVIVSVAEVLAWSFGVWLAISKRRYENQIEDIALACSASTGIEFKDDMRFRELVHMYYIDLKVKELLDGDR